jgi:hypothetical protein
MRLVASLFAVFSLLAGSAMANDGVPPSGVVELFTSQGCSSCRPADAAFETLVNQGDTLALAYHIDYWNYLGWTDTLASKQNTKRQYGYAKTMRRSSVYTPQAILNGRTDVSGADLAGIKDGLAGLDKKGEGLTVPIKASATGKEIDITVGAGTGKADVVIAYFVRHSVVKITRGENAGRTISYFNSVTDVETVGMWNGAPMALKIPMSVMDGSKYDGCAVLLQKTGPNGEPGPILGAAKLMAPAI